MNPPGTAQVPSAVLFSRTVERLERWTAMSSASGDPAGLVALSRQLVREAGSLGLSARVAGEADEDGRELPVVEMRSGRHSTAPLLLLGHYDTVLAAAAPRRDGNRLVATGAIDMKGGIAALFGALELVAERGLQPADFLLVLTPDEEVGGAISRRRVELHGPQARALWVLEPGERTEHGETIVTGRRGLFHWRLEIHGRAAHAGAQFWDGRSANAAAADWCMAAAGLVSDRHGPIVNLSRMVGGQRGLLDDPATHASVFGTARELNVVPDRALIEGEARFLRASEEPALRDSLAEAARDVASRHQVEVVFQTSGRVAPVDPARAGRQWSDLAVRCAANAGWRLTVEEERGGISFPNFLPDDSTIPVLDGLGPVGGGMHTREEFVELASLERRIVLLADLLAIDAATAGTA